MTGNRGGGTDYVLDGSDADLRRLVKISEFLGPATRAALATAAIQPGWRAVECGCGPLGALPILSELVGDTGHVVGLDFVASTVERAASVLRELGLTNAEVRVADINDPTAQVGGPYDLAFTRCFLMHQRDPLHTLTRIAAALRPGGWLVAMEPLPWPPPFSHPPNEALQLGWEMTYRAVERAGASATAVCDLPATAELAGFDVAQLGGSFQPSTDAITVFGLHAATMLAVRDRVISTGVASAQDADGVIAQLQTAGTDPRWQWVTSPVSLVVTLRKRG